MCNIVESHSQVVNCQHFGLVASSSSDEDSPSSEGSSSSSEVPGGVAEGTLRRRLVGAVEVRVGWSGCCWWNCLLREGSKMCREILKPPSPARANEATNGSRLVPHQWIEEAVGEERQEPTSSHGPAWPWKHKTLYGGSLSLTAAGLTIFSMVKRPINRGANFLDSTRKGRSRVDSHTFWPTW